MSDSIGQALSSSRPGSDRSAHRHGGSGRGGLFTGGGFVTGLELMIAGFGTVLFVGFAFLDFYTMPRTYSDDQYLAGALGMYLTYINLFIFILRLIIVMNAGGRRD